MGYSSTYLPRRADGQRITTLMHVNESKIREEELVANIIHQNKLNNKEEDERIVNIIRENQHLNRDNIVIENTTESLKVDKVTIKDEKSLYIKRKKIPKHIKTLVWKKYMGDNIVSGKCPCCKEQNIEITNFHCGHIKSVYSGGLNELENLLPICGGCNTSMGKKHWNEYEKEKREIDTIPKSPLGKRVRQED
jgi:hypothetical protein